MLPAHVTKSSIPEIASLKRDPDPTRNMPLQPLHRCLVVVTLFWVAPILFRLDLGDGWEDFRGAAHYIRLSPIVLKLGEEHVAVLQPDYAVERINLLAQTSPLERGAVTHYYD